MEYSNLFVVLMGLGVVFFGLIVLILLVMAMSGVMRKFNKKTDMTPAATTEVPTVADGRVTPEIIAVIGTAIAEEMGTDVSAIRIISCKRV